MKRPANRWKKRYVEIGKRTTIDLGIHGLHPELIRLVGKMKYRSSYGQNLLHALARGGQPLLNHGSRTGTQSEDWQKGQDCCMTSAKCLMTSLNCRMQCLE
ncbi:MAG: hypothetical protein MZV63_08560 [Marinilabiliales bacterium]|nr:hypothetical protein [Marinilabiliales bacterium]